MRMSLRLYLITTLAAVAACRQAPAPPNATAAGAAVAATPNEQLLLAAAEVALPPAGLNVADLPEPGSAGAQLLGRYCAQCHALPTPGAHSATDWPSVARRMWLRMDWLPASLGVRAPTLAERFTILDYLTTNALKVSGANLPAGRGREVFSLICSRCHALPDPRVHSPDDWPTVFSRMERNMERMKVAGPTAEQASDLLLYLQTVSARPRRRT
jgi:cytochrome c5